jgi:excisionase family DNA binding protein
VTGDRVEFAECGTGLQIVGNTHLLPAVASTVSQQNAAFCTPFAAHLLPASGAKVEQAGAIRTHVGKALLTVREVADQLRVCRATVYGLCESGELAHVRVRNALRITRADLASFILSARGNDPSASADHHGEQAARVPGRIKP